jgi:hypothetical protein
MKPCSKLQILFTRAFAILQISPQDFQIHILAPRAFQNSGFTLQTSNIHIFPTATSNQVILVPKFLESHPLSLQTIHIIMIVPFV